MSVQAAASVRVKVENIAPEYWRKNGGAHWVVTTVGGAQASACRAYSADVWCVFGPDGQTLYHPCVGAAEILAHLRRMLRDALAADLSALAESA